MQLINNGVFTVNTSSPGPSKRTMIIFGVPRSGTTMASKILQSIGVDMGKADNAVVEDIEFANLIEKNQSVEAIQAYIHSRNSSAELWGWKRPEAFRYRNRFLPRLRNPHLIIVFRDPLAIALREHISMGEPVVEKMKQAAQRYQAIIRFVEETDLPCLLISYEKALLNPEETVRSIGAFSGLDMTDDLVEKAIRAIKINDQQYLNSTVKRKQRLRGAVEQLTSEGAEGWAVYNKGTAVPELVFMLRGKEVGRAKPDQESHPEKERFPDKAAVGFRLRFDKKISQEDLAHIIVEDVKLRSQLRIKRTARA